MGKESQVRVSKDLIEKAREEYPELRRVSDTDVVDIIMRKHLEASKECDEE